VISENLKQSCKSNRRHFAEKASETRAVAGVGAATEHAAEQTLDCSRRAAAATATQDSPEQTVHCVHQGIALSP